MPWTLICTTQAIQCTFPSQNQQNVKFLPEFLIFQEPLIIETRHLHHWIWHTSHPKYVSLKSFWCIFSSQNQQNVKFLPEFVIFQEPLIVETRNLCHWNWHTLNPKYAPLKPFWCIFPCQNQQNVNFLVVYWTPLDKKWKKNVNLNIEKVFEKAWKSAHIGFWICQLQCSMLELCVTSTFWVMRVSLNFWQKGLGIGLWNMVYG